MNKTALINALKTIGTEGFDGITSNGHTKSSAFASATNLEEEQAKKIYNELYRQKLISSKKKSEKLYVFTLTPAGAMRLLKAEVDEIKLQNKKKWDDSWHFVCFDFPKGKDKERLFFNRRLHKLGLHMMQRSLWVYPYPCIEEVMRIANYLNLGKHISYFEASKIDSLSEKKLQIHFNNIVI